MSPNNPNYTLHLGIAERGKMFALETNYTEALRYYREAIKMTQGQEGAELFFQHYTQCVMETLELSKAYDQVIAYCEKFIDFLENKEENSVLIDKHYATILEKMGVQYLLKEEKATALPLFKAAQDRLGKGKQPLTDELINWIQRGYTISAKQISDLQKRHHYFIVQKETLKPDLAIDLPKAMTPF
jgi:tetratricopeptide (TPR) repeat protein